MRTLFFTFLFLFTSTTLLAQRMQDVVYLKNGSVVRGKVLSHIPGQTIKVETADQSIWVFETTNVDSITYERVPGKKIDLKTKGYYNVTNFGVLAGRDDWGTRYSFSLNTINGWKLNKRFGVGLGAGLEVINDASFFPLFGEGRFDLQHQGFSPFVSVYSGYALPTQSRINSWPGELIRKGGFMAGGEIGIRNYISSNSAFVFGVGFRYMHLNEETADPWGWPEGTVIRSVHNLSRISIKMGFLFN